MQDPGQSGASLERPGMDHVRDLVAAGVITFVLAQDRDRLARKPAYHYLLHREFEEYSCEMRSLGTLLLTDIEIESPPRVHHLKQRS
jgi:site-specific DNA recombinase